MEAQIETHDRRLREHHDRLERLANDVEHVKSRLGQLEQDRQLVRELAETTRELARKTKELADGIEAIAERAVERFLERRREIRLRDWRYRAGWVTAIVAVTGFLIDHRLL